MKDWKDLRFWTSRTYQDLTDRIAGYEDNGVDVLPTRTYRYRTFDITRFEEVRCVILGQDPYHTKGAADGLAFSVHPGYVGPTPPSLHNIFNEYSSDLGYSTPSSNSLLPWARRGVFLFNTCLTVQAGKPNSHKGIGWERLTLEVIRTLSEDHDQLAFLLWGRSAQEFRGLIDADKHHIVESSHPSPYSAKHGFLGSRPFTRVNQFITEPIDWRLP